MLTVHQKLVTLLALFSVGCASGAPPATSASEEAPAPGASASAASVDAAPAPSSDALSLEEGTAFCVRLHESVVPCAGEFIDLNIDLRSRYFPEFAQKLSTPEARAEARKLGIEEVQADGAGPLEPRRQRCRGYAQHGPPTPRSAVPPMEVCFAKAACAEKIECMRPVLDARFKARAEAPR